jgi:hypothetical protein
MKIADTVHRRGLGVYKTFCAMAVVSMFIASFGYAAQRDSQLEITPKADTNVEQRGTVTVEVLSIESENDQKRRPVPGANVHIHGADDPQETNEKGRVRFSGVPTGELNLHIIVPHMEICRLSRITVSKGEQLIEVLVDKSQQGKCTRLQ